MDQGEQKCVGQSSIKQMLKVTRLESINEKVFRERLREREDKKLRLHK